MEFVSKQSRLGAKEFIALMAVMMSVVAMTIDATLPALGVIGRDLGLAYPNQAQYIISCVFMGMAFGHLFSGPLSDALGRRKLLFCSLCVFFTGSGICLFAPTMEIMLIGRFIQGLGVSGPYVSTVSIVRDQYSGRSMARIMSLVMMVFMTVPTLAPAMGQGILLFASWHYIFAFYIFYAVVVGIWVFFRLEETLPVEERIPYKVSNIINGLKTIVQNRVTVRYTLAMGCVFGAMIGYLSSIQQIYQGQFGVGDMFVVYFGLQALSLGVSSFCNSRLVERLGMRYLCLRAVLVVAAISILFLGVHQVIDVIPFWMFFTYGLILLFSLGLLFGNLNALAMEPMGHLAGTAAAIIGCTSTTIAMVLGSTIGQQYNGTLVPILSGFLVLSLVAFVIIATDKETH